MSGSVSWPKPSPPLFLDRNNSEPGLSNKYELEIDLTYSSVLPIGPDFSSGKIKRDRPLLPWLTV